MFIFRDHASIWPALVAIGMFVMPAAAQVPAVRSGDPVPRDVRELYDAGCRYLVRSQDPSGTWRDSQQGPGVTGMAMMVLLASGEDPNHGAYRTQIRRALRNIIVAQDAASGYFGGGEGNRPSMYQHGFAMLALAEAYGMVDDRRLWSDEGGGRQGPIDRTVARTGRKTRRFLGQEEPGRGMEVFA